MRPEEFGLLSDDELTELQAGATKVELVLIANIRLLWREKIQDVELKKGRPIKTISYTRGLW